MRRHALLIGYSGWDIKNRTPLSGVAKDLENYENYLHSLNGGGCYYDEITTLKDKDLYKLKSKIVEIKSKHYDLVFVAYSWHGLMMTKKHIVIC